MAVGQPSTNPRLLKEALWFSDRGYEVHVLYCFWSKWGYNADRNIIAKYPSIKWKEIGGNPYTKRLEYFFTRFRFKVFRTLSAQFSSSLFWAERSMSRCFFELFRSGSTINASLYIAHNLGALPVVGKIASKLKKPFVFDAEDFHRGQSISGSISFQQSSLLENYWMPKAKLITAASPFIANKYSDLLGVESLVINNVFSIKNAPVLKVSISKPIKLFWFSQTVGKGRGLEDVLNALKKFTLDTFSITIMGDSSIEMENYLRGLVVENNEVKVSLHFLTPVDPDKIVDIASTFDIGLATEPVINENNDLIFTNKLFTYLVSGNAILFSATTAQEYFFNTHSNIGWIYNGGDIDRLVLILEQINRDQQELLFYKQNARKLAAQVYNWEIEQSKMMNHLNLIEENA
jgi:glycosyltransferase involved in cell wall biosynthesis